MEEMFKTIKVKMDVYLKLKKLKREKKAENMSEVISWLLQSHVLPPTEIQKILNETVEKYFGTQERGPNIKLSELNFVLNSLKEDPPHVVDGDEVYYIILSPQMRILDGRGEPYSIEYSLVLEGLEKRIYIVRKEILEGKLLIFVKDNKGEGIKFKGGKHKIFFIGEVTV